MTASVLCEQRADPSPSAVLKGGGTHMCSLATRSLHECKEHVLLVCIAFLEALEQLQQRLHLPLKLVHELQTTLGAMVERSLVRPVPVATQAKLDRAVHVGRMLFPDAKSKPTTKVTGSRRNNSRTKATCGRQHQHRSARRWRDALVPEQIRAFVGWLLALLRALNELVVASSIGVYRRVCVLVMTLPGMPTACRLFGHIYKLVQRAVWEESTTEVAAMGREKQVAGLENYMGDPALTAVVLEYREKESMVPMSINRRIQRVMHFPIPLRSFEATVRLPRAMESGDGVYSPPDADRSALVPSRYLYHKSVSPQSIPVSPKARKRVQLAFSHFSDEVLYQARDRLRRERAVTLTGDGHLRIPRFNAKDCDEEMRLSCGQNCAVKIGTGMYRGVRGSVPVWRNRFVYFEMELREPGSTLRSGYDSATAQDVHNSSDLSVAIGLSTRGMPLNMLVGTARHSVGFYSAGQVLVGGQRRNFILAQHGYAVPSTVGVLVRIKEAAAVRFEEKDSASTIAVAQVRFSVDGVAVRDSSNNVLVVTFPLPSQSDLFPTLTLHSQHIQVYAHFTAADATSLNLADFGLDRDRTDVWCLDGLKVAAN